MKNNHFSVCQNDDYKLGQNYDLNKKYCLNKENTNILQNYQNMNLSFSQRMKLKVLKTKEYLEKKEENLEKTLKPLRNNLIAFVTASTRRQEEIKKTATDNIEDAKKAMRTGLNNADKAEQEALAHLESELAGREAILSFSKNEISNAVSTFKKEYETKVKLQNKLYKEKLSEELAKISNQLTTELSNLTQ